METITLSPQDLDHFYHWLSFDKESESAEDLNEFWHLFFLENISFQQMTPRFSYASERVKSGPLKRWFKWLQEQLIIYCFIHKKMTIEHISDQSEISSSLVALIIRDFFLTHYSRMVDSLNQFLNLEISLLPAFVWIFIS